MVSMVLCSELHALPERSECLFFLIRIKDLRELGNTVGQKMVGLG